MIASHTTSAFRDEVGEPVAVFPGNSTRVLPLEPLPESVTRDTSVHALTQARPLPIVE